MKKLIMKSYLHCRVLLLTAASLLFTACAEETDRELDSHCKNLQISVSTGGWNETRAAYGTISENAGRKTFSVSFGAGDAIGVFVVDKTGKVIVENKKYTYNESGWTTDVPITYVSGMGSYAFFAYYPWKATLTDAPSLNSTVEYSTAEVFFEDAEAAWSVEADQSSVENFTNSDLMIAKGTTTIPLFHEVQVAFTLKHRMGLLVTKDRLLFYDMEDPSDSWEVEQDFTGNIPLHLGDLYYYIAKPGITTTLGKKTVTAEAGTVEQLFFSNGEPGNR